MISWDCCRTCLSTNSLNNIFSSVKQNEKNICAVFTAFGVKVEPNDSLPQKMCSTCINFINTSKEFRKKAEESQKELFKRLQNNEYGTGDTLPKQECVTVDTYDDLDFNDDDEITLDNLKHTCKVEDTNQHEFECKTDETDKPIEIVLDNKRKRNTTKAKTVKRKPRNKIEKDTEGRKEKKERVKEEIECEYCHKILTSKLSLRNHYKIHTGFDVVCEHCGKKFITRRLLLMHCRAKHGYEKTDKCSYCDYRASNAEQVKIHERLHTGERPFSCAQCGAGFHRKSSYLQHVAIHLPEKTVQCSQCPARFKSVTLMRIHAHRHRAPAHTFLCTMCGNTFARRRNASRHLQRIHMLSADDADDRIQRQSLAQGSK